MTTDLVPKTAFAEVKLRRGTVRIAGMTKGSGMIQPHMATTLGFVMTDANIPAAQLRAMLKRAVERSYNRLSVDGDTSTNDTLVLLANGASGVRPDPKEFAGVRRRRSPASWRRWRGRSRATARAPGSSSPSTSPAPPPTMPPRASRAPSPIRRWSRPRSPAPTPTGAASSPPPATPAWPSIRRRSISTCRACWCAAAAWPRHSPKPS